MIPSAIQLFNKQTNEKKQNLRNFIGLKAPYKDCSAGLYGINFCETSYVSETIDKSDYVACLEKNCSFRGPLSMMDLHTRTVHEMGLEREINVDNETWRENRKKKFPTLERIKEKMKVNTDQNTKELKVSYKENQKRKSITNSEENVKQESLTKRIMMNPDNSREDILGLAASYASDNDDKPLDNKQTKLDEAFSGLPLLGETQKHVRKNKYRFPILPHMELIEKRNKMMNPERRYMENNNIKKKRPRLSEMLLAAELSSHRNCVLQCVRYLCNKHFYNPTLATLLEIDQGSSITKVGQQEDLNEDIFKIEEAVSDDDDSIVWSDEEL